MSRILHPFTLHPFILPIWIVATLCLPFGVFAQVTLTKTIDNPSPTPGSPVEFEVTVENTGTDTRWVDVSDVLPEGLETPSGLAIFTSQGTYREDIGVWEVGDLAAGNDATMLVPAMIVGDQPPCLVNVARGNGEIATAGIRREDTDTCIDVAVRLSNAYAGLFCGTEHALDIFVAVENLGLDTVSNVVLDLEISPVVAPNLRFTSTQCSGLRCTFAKLEPGESVELWAQSDVFSNTQARDYQILLTVSAAGTDFDPDNNQSTSQRTLRVFEDCNFSGGFGAGIGPAGCFIATAAYGTPLHPHIDVLRQFRDEQLMRSSMGRTLVSLYYTYSPTLAGVISAHESLRFITRVLLAPLIYGLMYPGLALGLLLLLIMIPGVFRHRKKM